MSTLGVESRRLHMERFSCLLEALLAGLVAQPYSIEPAMNEGWKHAYPFMC
jgi:hypothetical protein